MLRQQSVRCGAVHRAMKVMMLLISCIVISSCSGRSGSWDDDPLNWGRAFGGQQKPSDITVAHSHYWRSPHFTYEAEYFFEFTAPKEFIDRWISEQNLVLTPFTEPNTPDYYNKPAWFTPKSSADYDMWQADDNTSGSFRIFRDRATGTFFVTDCST
jgi:hypothetical protein